MGGFLVEEAGGRVAEGARVVMAVDLVVGIAEVALVEAARVEAATGAGEGVQVAPMEAEAASVVPVATGDSWVGEGVTGEARQLHVRCRRRGPV